MTKRWTVYDLKEFLGSLKKEHIRFTLHGKKQLKRYEKKESEIPKSIVVDLLINETPVSITKQHRKKFGLMYPYPLDKNHDLFVAISIKDKFINIVTIYKSNKEKRWKPNGIKKN